MAMWRDSCDVIVLFQTQHCAAGQPCPPSSCGNEDKTEPKSIPCDPIGSDPIIVDVAGNGFSLTDYASGVQFDFAATGTKFKLAWTAPNSDDAFLAMDRNGNGVIDDGSELFGDVTPQPESWLRNGFQALAVLDGNRDGVIDKNDVHFPRLLLWQDTNHNGISEGDELQKLKDSGLKVINCDYKPSRREDQYGNQFRFRTKLKDSPNSQIGRWAFDVFLAIRP